MTRPRVVIAEPLHPDPVAWLRERADVVETLSDETLRDADALIVRTYTRVDAALLARAPRLRVVGRAGVGTDNIDRAACEPRGIRVVCTPDANTSAVVEYVLSAIFSRLRPIEPAAPGMDARAWEAARTAAIAPRELSECVVGIWGLGRIGKALARALAPLAGGVIYHDLVEIPERDRAGARPVSERGLLETSDIVSIHVDGRATNHALVGAPQLGYMRPHALLINASRGMVVHAAALAEHMGRCEGFRAVLDVHAPEPIARDNPLLETPGATLTAHVGAATAKAKLAMSWVVRGVYEAMDHGTTSGPLR